MEHSLLSHSVCHPSPASNLGKILLIDHDPDQLSVLVDCFSAYGFELTVVSNGGTAWETCEMDPPDLILMDVNIPEMGGFELCRQLKEDARLKDIPVIFMKASDDDLSPVKGFSVGAVDYVNKPLQIEELLARTTTHLKICHLQQQLEETVSALQQEVDVRKRAEEVAQEALLQAQRANEYMRRDLEAAARVQQALLPSTIPNLSEASFAWLFRPCTELGGDSLNVFPLSDHQIGLYILDVTGHGVPAALLSVTLSRMLIPRRDPSCIFTHSNNDGTNESGLISPANVASRLNQLFPMSQNGNQYFTLIYGILDTHKNVFQYVCAGHPPPLLLAPNNSNATFCEAPSLPIGLMEDEQYETCTIHLEPKTRMYLYSDGILEAMNVEREIFGESQLCRALESMKHTDLQESVDSIADLVSQWVQEGHIQDDFSILAFELK